MFSGLLHHVPPHQHANVLDDAATAEAPSLCVIVTEEKPLPDGVDIKIYTSTDITLQELPTEKLNLLRCSPLHFYILLPQMLGFPFQPSNETSECWRTPDGSFHLICWIVIVVGIITFFIALCCIFHIVKLCRKLEEDKRVSTRAEWSGGKWDGKWEGGSTARARHDLSTVITRATATGTRGA